jgi:tetratricopeptide (TPR) repeat protein
MRHILHIAVAVVCTLCNQSYCKAIVISQMDSSRVDSLKTRLAACQLAELKYEILEELVMELADDDNGAAVRFAHEALAVATQSEDTTRLIESTRWIGQLMRRMGDNEGGMKFLSSALTLARLANSDREILRITNSLGVAYAYAGRYDSALRYYLQTLRLRSERNESKEMGVTLNNIGLLFYSMGDIEEGKNYYEKSAEMYRISGDSEYLPDVLVNLSLCHSREGNFSSAEKFIAMADSICHGTCNSYFQMSSAFAKGQALLLGQKFSLALPYFQLSLKLAQSAGDSRFEIDGMVGIARCFAATGKKQEAKAILGQCEQKAIESGFDQSLISVYKEMVPILQGNPDLGDLASLQAKFIEVKDRVFHESMVRRASMARVEFEEHQNHERIASQAALLVYNQKMLSRQKWLSFSAIVIAFLLTVLAIVLYRFSLYQKNLSKLLDRRVFERTRELAANETELMRRLGEQRALMDLISSRLHSAIATVKGLWNLSVGPGGRESKQEFETVASDLFQVLQIVGRSRDSRVESRGTVLSFKGDDIPQVQA